MAAINPYVYSVTVYVVEKVITIKNFIPDSLQGRYLLSAVVFISVITIGTWWSSYHAHKIQNDSITNIILKNQSQKITREIRFLMWEVNHSLQSYMVEPELLITDKIRKIIEHSKRQILHLKKINIPKDYKWLESIDVLDNLIIELHTMMLELIKIRNDPIRLHPAMKAMQEVMLPSSNSFSTASILALEEIEFDNLVSNAKIQKLFDKINDNWNKMIGAFRVFIANRFGAFSTTEEGIADQARNVETLYEVIRQDLHALELIDLKTPLDLQGQESLKIMKQTSVDWFNAYHVVRESYLSKEWRADVPFLHNKIKPTLIAIWNSLDEIDLIIDMTSDEKISNMSSIAGNINNILWLFSIIAFLVTIVGYIFFQKTILFPIKQLSNALSNEAHGFEYKIIDQKAQIGEMKALHQAFDLMRNKVHERETELQIKALHDPLTELPNRTLMEDRLLQAITASDREKKSSAVMLIDLNKFKPINDSMGHYVGDLILQETANRLISVLRSSGTVSRIGGDEFAIVIPGVNEFDLKLIVKRILEAFKLPYTIESKVIFIEMSIGVSVYPKDGKTPETLLRNADSAMYLAKKEGRPVQYFLSTDTM